MRHRWLSSLCSTCGCCKKLRYEVVVLGSVMKLVKTVPLSLAAALERLVAKSRVYGKHSKIKNNKI